MRRPTLISRIVPMFVTLALFVAFVPAQCLAQDGNLLENPGFEGEYSTWWDGDTPWMTAQMAPGWTPWWQPQAEDDLSWRNRQPEWKPAEAPWMNRVRSGDKAQQYFTFYGTHIGGVYQHVDNVRPGSQLRFTIWAQVWSSAYDDADTSEAHGQVDMQVGIDPKGGTNPFSNDIKWSDPKQQYDEWFLLSVEATATANSVTVYVRSAPEFPVKHNDIYLDDALLVITGEGPVPTDQPSPPPGVNRPATSPPLVATQAPTQISTQAPTALPSGTVPYTVVAGDSLYYIALRFNTTVSAITNANNLADPNRLSVGQRLLIPDQPLPTPIPLTPTPIPGQYQPTPIPQSQPPTAIPAPPTGTYTVQVGDNLFRIALRYSTTVEALSAINGIVNPNLISVGQVLRVSGTAAAPPATQPAASVAPGTTHIVQPGENAFRIALRYHTTVEALAAANGLANPNLIHVGQVLVIK